MGRGEDSQFRYVGKTKEEALELLHTFFAEYLRGRVRWTKLAYQHNVEKGIEEGNPFLLEHLIESAKQVWTDRPMTRCGLSGHQIAELVLPAVWEMMGGDREKYREFFVEHIVPLGVREESLTGYSVAEEATLC